MPCKKTLKNIAGGLSGSFVSRNNDSDGYWAIGKLYSLALSKGLNTLRIPIKPAVEGGREPLIEFVSGQYGSMLERLLTRASVQTVV